MSLFSCETNKIRNYLVGSWVVTSIEYNGERYKNGIGFALLNFMIFNKNSKCELPMRNDSRIDAKAEWKVIKKGANFFLRIKNCKEKLYNGDYLIIQRNESQKRMILKSEILELKCDFAQF